MRLTKYDRSGPLWLHLLSAALVGLASCRSAPLTLPADRASELRTAIERAAAQDDQSCRVSIPSVDGGVWLLAGPYELGAREDWGIHVRCDARAALIELNDAVENVLVAIVHDDGNVGVVTLGADFGIEPGVIVVTTGKLVLRRGTDARPWTISVD